MEDQKIVELYFERNEDAIRETARKYDAYCTSIAMNILNSPPDAEECVSDTYLRTWNSIPPQRPSSLRLFLATIVRRLAIDRYRSWHSRKRNRELELSFEELETCIPAREDTNPSLLLSHINSFLAAQKQIDRVIFVQKYWYSLTPEQIGRDLGMTPGAVRTRLHRIRESLRVYLEKRGYSI